MTAPGAPGSAQVLTLLTREDCELCEQMQRELTALARRVPLPPVELRDVDSDAQLRRRFGLKIPVLLLDGVPVCHARLDADELLRALSRSMPSAPPDTRP